MKKLLTGIIIVFLISACSSLKSDYLVKFHLEEYDELGVPTGYLNSKGDTIIPIGKYHYCYTDTIRNFGMVIEKGTERIIGIDQNEAELFEVFKYDQGPDYIESGLFRIIKNGKFGYADKNGKIKIKPNFDCARPFKGEFAEVSNYCETIKDGKHYKWESEEWYFITKRGKRAKK